jgi:hypothetical protein
LDDVENYVKKTRVRGWKKLIGIENAWIILKEAKVLHRRYSHWRKKEGRGGMK